jgi:hypothetical protein
MGSLYRRRMFYCATCEREKTVRCVARGHNIRVREWPTWWIKYYQNGQRVRESNRHDEGDGRPAHAAGARGRRRARYPIAPKLGRVTFEDAAEDVKKDYKSNGKRSLGELERRIDKHLRPFFRGRRLAAITTSDVRAYIAKRQGDLIETGKGDDRRSRPVSNGEINRELGAEAHVLARNRRRQTDGAQDALGIRAVQHRQWGRPD